MCVEAIFYVDFFTTRWPELKEAVYLSFCADVFGERYESHSSIPEKL